MGFLRVAVASLALASLSIASAGIAPAQMDEATPVAGTPDPFATPNLHPFKHPTYARYAAEDPALVTDVHASTSSGLVAYRTLTEPVVSGYLEPSEGVVGECGSKYYAAVPLDSGSVAGFAGWLIYYAGEKRHVAIVPASEGLEFRNHRIRASNFIYDPRKDSSSSVHRVDSWTCRANGLHLVETHVLPVP